jgi:predicted NAD-dependent protein-ADP-ribosyltransferase YbiA (DUF1768 family)
MSDKFIFKSNSPSLFPGQYKSSNGGCDWSEYVSDNSKYVELAKVKNWRQMFSNFYESSFILDGLSWNSVEHYFHAMKFRDTAPDFFRSFSLDSGSPWSISPNLSKMAGKAGRVSKTTGKVYDKKIEGIKIPKDVSMIENFYTSGLDKKSMTIAFFSKFCQNEELKQALLKTYDADLYHLVTERGKKSHLQLWDNLARVRECIRKFDNTMDLKEVSKISSEICNIVYYGGK